MKAAGYIRVSTSGQAAEDKMSLENQEKKIRNYCKTEEFELIEPFYKDVISGARDDRPGLQALLAAARRKEFEHVVVNDLTRFGRSAKDLLTNTEELKGLGIIFHSVKDKLDLSTQHGKLFFTILSAIAEFELETIKVRMSDVKMVKWRAGKIFVGHPPFGYKWSKETQSVEIYKKEEDGTYTEEAGTYLHIVSQYLDFGKSLATICSELNTNKIPTHRKNTDWFVPVVSRILRHTAYWTGTITTNQGKAVKDQIDYKCEPLLSKSRWESVQARLQSNKIRSGRPNKAADVFLLHGLIYCGMCRSKMYAVYDSRMRKDGTYKRYYACYYRKPSNAAEDGREPCVLPYISADEIEDYVWKELLRLLSAHGDKSKLIDSDRWNYKERMTDQKVKCCEDELKKSKLALDRLELILKEPGNFDPDSFLEMRSKFQKEITQHSLEVREATDELNNLRKMREEEEKLIQFAKDKSELLHQVRDILNDLPYSEKQKFVKGFLAQPIVLFIMPDWDYMELEGITEPPEKIGWKHWSEAFMPFIPPFRFNWPLLQEILSKYLPPNPDGSGDVNGNSSPHRSSFGEI
jgi:site-specific DNA recombinase